MSKSVSKPKNQTRQERVADREAVIIKAARHIFNGKGFAKTTIAEIARASQVADGTVYLYFKNKEDLGRAVLADFYKVLTQSAQIGVDKRAGVQSKLRFLARHHIRNVMNNWRVLEMLPLVDMNLEHYEGSALYRLNRAYVSVFDRVARQAMAEGLLPEATQLWVLRDMFFGAMEYSARTMLFIRQDTDINNFVDNLILLILGERQGHASFMTVSNSSPTDLVTRLESVTNRLEKLV